MIARLRRIASTVADSFWIVPAVVIVAAIGLAEGLVAVDRAGLLAGLLVDNRWLYNGGATGARTLLGAVASSTIGVAGTVFSITIASLSLAAGQMGPRLLRNFVRDRGNQVTLGVFLGTFSYALMVLRNVRTSGEGEFIPHLSMSVGIALAFVCVGTLVYFVGHTASRINVDTVIDLVAGDLTAAIKRLTTRDPEPGTSAPQLGEAVFTVPDARRGYLKHLDADGLADWAAKNATTLQLLVRPGDCVFPGAVIALITPAVAGAGIAIRAATALAKERVSDEDLEYAVRQLVEVAVRALSPGINDPNTAMSVLDRMGAALCELAPRYLHSGRWSRDGRVVLVVPAVDYDGLTNAMLDMIRQNAASSMSVLIRFVEVLTAVAGCERDAGRLATLRRHADLALGDGVHTITTPADLDELRRRHARLVAMIAEGPVCLARLDRPGSVSASGAAKA
ncbi:DUF2254 domain-containing protein [Glacieibacterium megasporae]|uniref:DUF2254 domain-containing protein n=1 Tax=Glacieibacterium megasporae TaxID=2835787 RepID=UPI001C1DE384|nr:DUF2254 domain-containing protein [Polymorphobacter megasporae]UAJ09699.1 DUF2254 domain-containing protein [Polymorphobacter megasporae]